MSERDAHEIILRLRRIRRMRDITQRELVDKTGYSRETFSQWENGKRTPNVFQFLDWAEALGQDVELRDKESE